MKYLLTIVALAWPIASMSSQCGEPDSKKWNTVVKLEAAAVTLHWTTVYEAPSAVCQVTYKTEAGTLKTFEVWGQPVPNETTNQIAFVSCRDDGCSSDIVVTDFMRGAVFKTALPVDDSQFYLKAKWLEVSHKLQVEVERFQTDPAHKRYLQYFESTTAEGINCKLQESNPPLNRTRADNARAG